MGKEMKVEKDSITTGKIVFIIHIMNIIIEIYMYSISTRILIDHLQNGYN